MNSTKENILVTGGAGYIGSHTCKALAKHSYNPVVLDNLSTGRRGFVKWGPLVEGDISDRELVKQTLAEYDITSIIHFAASAYVIESMENPCKYFDNNVINSLRFLENLTEKDKYTIIFSSSCATYGLPEKLPLTEDHPQNPVNPYGETKLFIEKALKWYHQIYGLNYAALRYFNASGADPDGDIGEWHEPETHLIPNVLLAAKNDQPVEIYGNDFPTKDGTAVRDYIHVSDLAEAHVLALKTANSKHGKQVYNLGAGRGYSILEIVEAAKKITGKEIQSVFNDRRPGDPPQLIASAGAAHHDLGWKPQYSDLDTIIKTAWQWLRQLN